MHRNISETRSLSLSDLTVDSTRQNFHKRRCDSVSSLQYFYCDGSHLLKSRNEPTRDESLSVSNTVTTGSPMLICSNNVPKLSLSLSNLTEDKPTVKVNIRCQSAPPTMKHLGYECPSPSILAFWNVCEETNNDSVVQRDGSTSESDMSDVEYYGDMDEGRKRRHDTFREKKNGKKTKPNVSAYEVNSI